MSAAVPVVVFLGHIGHGKTHLVNKLCGTRHTSDARSVRCTRSLQWGYSTKHKIFVVDTPGIGSDEEVSKHIAAQKVSLEFVALSGVYMVVKFEHRDSNICRLLEHQMDFLGSDDVRVIVTHADTANHDGYDADRFMEGISRKLNIPRKNIFMSGINTSGVALEDFVKSTLHDPVQFSVSDVQIAAVSCLSGTRKYNKPINIVAMKIKAAGIMCQELVSDGKSYEKDLVIIATQTKTSKMVAKAKEEIFKSAYADNISVETQNMIYGKAGVSLSLALKDFTKATNKLLSWDVTDPKDKRNQYRKCPNCDAVYVHVGGCGNLYSCGGAKHVPDRESSNEVALIDVEFIEQVGANTYVIEFVVGGVRYTGAAVANKVSELITAFTKTRATNDEIDKKRDSAKKDGNCELNIFCFKTTTWDQMLPLTQEQLDLLGEVDFQRESDVEEMTRNVFNASLTMHAKDNSSVLKYGLNRRHE